MGTTFNDLEWPLTPHSRSQHFSTLITTASASVCVSLSAFFFNHRSHSLREFFHLLPTETNDIWTRTIVRGGSKWLSAGCEGQLQWRHHTDTCRQLMCVWPVCLCVSNELWIIYKQITHRLCSVIYYRTTKIFQLRMHTAATDARFEYKL